MSRNTVTIVMPGDARPTANKGVWPKAEEGLDRLLGCLKSLRYKADVPYRGLISSQAQSADVLSRAKGDAIIAFYTGWAFSGHLTQGLLSSDHADKPLLMLSNFRGEFPGLVALLNTSGSLTLFGREHSRLWTNEFEADAAFMKRLGEFMKTGRVKWELDPYISPAKAGDYSGRAGKIGTQVAEKILEERRLVLMLGICSMQMFNAMIPLELLNRVGFGVEIIDQAQLLHRTLEIPDSKGEQALKFCQGRGAQFHFGSISSRDLTPDQVVKQFRMMRAALDLMEEYGADCGGTQYQLGLIESWPATDLWDGLMNNRCRPWADGNSIAWATEADFGNLLPMQLLKEILLAKRQDPEVYFHDVRWGKEIDGEFVWVLLNSGCVAPYFFNRSADTLEGMHSYRQPAMYFKHGGGTCAGITLPGEMTYARAYMEDGQLKMIVGKQEVKQYSPEQVAELLDATNPEWPIAAAVKECPMHVIMGHFPSNHEAGCYGDQVGELVACCERLGIPVSIYHGGKK